MSKSIGQSELLDQLIADIRSRWRSGDKVLADSYVEQHPELQSDDGLLSRLVLVEIQLRREFGEHPDQADYVRRFPQLAGRLPHLLQSGSLGAATSRPAHGSDSTHPIGSPPINQSATVSFDQPAGQSNVDSESAAHVVAPLGRFGGYELLQEIARGGMGIVYKARQIKANRTVALKMILAGQLASPDDVRRFETEASAAATLDHPNIVPIFEVGEHEGRHFYSMGFVDGQSLSERLREGPLASEEAARSMRQVALAVEYAHSKGIVHRDLKPQNILLSREGSPRVVDFGLAKQLSVNSELTAAGQILGTPNFMSPEQARGAHTEIGPLSDVYSLGAVLYCLLTGRPPFQAADVIETLRQVVAQEPPSPRLLNAAVDRDLETITLKCLQKEPGRRYATAKELADDLDRFLEGKPIQARPIGTLERTWRWCRRNPLPALLSTAVALLLLTGAIGGTWLAIGEKSARDAADQNAQRASDEADNARKARSVAENERAEATRQRNEAIKQRQAADAQRTLAEAARRTAELEKKRAETNLVEANRQKLLADRNFRQAKKAVDQYLTHVGEDPELVDNPDLAPLRDKLFESAVDFYRSFAAVRTKDPVLRAEQAAAHVRVSSIKHAQGKKEEWVPELKKGLDLVAELVDQGATREQLAPLSAGLYTNRDQTSMQVPSDARAAVQVLENGAKSLSILVARYPEVPGFKSDLAGIYHMIATLEAEGGDRMKAGPPFLRAGKLLEDLVARFPRDPDYRRTLSIHLMNKGGYLGSLGQREGALKVQKRAVALAEKVNEECPGRPFCKCNLHTTQWFLGSSQAGVGDYQEAEASYRKSIAGLEELVARYPRSIDFRRTLAGVYTSLAQSLVQNNTLGEATAVAHKGLDQWMALRQAVGRAGVDRRTVVFAEAGAGRAAYFMAEALSAAEEWRDAISQFTDSTDLFSRLAKDAPNNRAFNINRVASLCGLAKAQAFAGRSEEYGATCAKLMALRKPEAELAGLAHPVWTVLLCSNGMTDYAALLRDFAKYVKPAEPTNAVSAQNCYRAELLGMLLYRAGQYDRALQQLNDWQAIREKTPAFKSFRPYGSFFLAMAHHRLGHKQEATKSLDKACEWAAIALGEAKPQKPQPKSKSPALTWTQLGSLKLYRREAEELIRGTETSRSPIVADKPKTEKTDHRIPGRLHH